MLKEMGAQRSKCGKAGKGSWGRDSLPEQMFPENTRAVVLGSGGTQPSLPWQCHPADTEQGQKPVPGAEEESREGGVWQILQADVSALLPLSVPTAARWNWWTTTLLSEQEDCHGSRLTRT